MTTFCHQPLTTKTCIRLVILHQGLEPNTIKCSLSEIDLKQDGEAADLPEYEALSYTWGPKGAERTILVDGTKVSIRHNLFSFLQQLRRHDSDRIVWVDALSISQTDLAEKADQVALIGRIFKSAVRVRAWVGEHANGSECLFRSYHSSQQISPWSVSALEVQLRRLSDDMIVIIFITAWISGPLGAMVGFKTNLRYGLAAGFSIALLVIISIGIWRSTRPVSVRETSYCNPVWRAFVRRTYFRRTWIVQEVAVANSVVVHCGKDYMSWQDIIESRLGIPDTAHQDFFTGRSVAALSLHPADEHIVLLNVLRNRANDISKDLSQLAYHTRRTECEDQRDRIYALLSTQQYPMVVSRLIPDYRVDVLDLALHLLRHVQTLQVPKLYRSAMILDLLSGMRFTGGQRLRLMRLGARKGLFLATLDLILFRDCSLSRILFGFRDIRLFAQDTDFLLSGRSGPASRSNRSEP